MTRPQLTRVAPSAEAVVAGMHPAVVEAVASTVTREPVVVVGMAQNPFVKKSRALLDAEKIAFSYLEYGSYLSQWKERLAIKLWAGFPTFPMVFIGGELIGGHAELLKLKDAGALPK